MTQNLQARVFDQQNDLHPRDFTSVHATHTLVHVEGFSDICEALARYELLREMETNRLSDLVDESNPDWQNLLGDFGGDGIPRQA